MIAMSNVNFVGDDKSSITIIPVGWSEDYTIIQALQRDESENHPTVNHVAQIMMNASALASLIDALVMRYNDLSAYARKETRLELKRVVDVAPKDESATLPY